MFENLEEINCPHCGANNPIEIVYGLPSDEMEASAAKGEIVLGGCTMSGMALTETGEIIAPNDPSYRCRNEECGRNFGETTL